MTEHVQSDQERSDTCISFRGQRVGKEGGRRESRGESKYITEK